MAGDGTAGDNNTAGDMLPGNGTDGMLPGTGNTDNPAGDDLLPGETAGDGATLGDTNGDGMTDDRAPETTESPADTGDDPGISWGGILLALLAAAAVVVVIILLVPKKMKN